MRLCVVAFTIAFAVAGPVRAEEYPIVFVHGWCTNSNTWNTMFTNLSRRRFGDELVHVYEYTDGQVYPESTVQTADLATLRSFAIDFFDMGGGGYRDTTAVANVPIDEKAGQLKVVVDAIKATTRRSKVIIVAHSMGGLIARDYVEGRAISLTGRIARYDGDVAELITIDTPHSGSSLADIPVGIQSQCIAAETVNKSEMQPQSLFLQNLNRALWADSTRLDAIVSYYSSGPAADSDWFVTRQSQDIRTISSYWAQHPSIHAYLQSFSPSETAVLHVDVHDFPVTASLVQGIVQEIDDASNVNPLPIACTIMSLSANDGLRAELTDSDCAAPHRATSRADVYSVQASSGQRIRITMDRDGMADPYLLLVNPAGAVVAEDDDSGGGTNAAISYIASATGRHTIEATSYDASDRGRYALSVAVSNDAPSAPTAALVAYFRFEGNSLDSSGSGNNGTSVGGVSFVSGRVGQAARFDGTTGYVTVPGSSSLALSRFTVAAWANPSTFTDGNRIAEKGNSDSWWLYLNVSGRPLVGFYDGSYHDLVGPSAVQTNTWTFIAGTYDGSTLRLYVNGTLVNSLVIASRPAQTNEPLAGR